MVPFEAYRAGNLATRLITMCELDRTEDETNRPPKPEVENWRILWFMSMVTIAFSSPTFPGYGTDTWLECSARMLLAVFATGTSAVVVFSYADLAQDLLKFALFQIRDPVR